MRVELTEENIKKIRRMLNLITPNDLDRLMEKIDMIFKNNDKITAFWLLYPILLKEALKYEL